MHIYIFIYTSCCCHFICLRQLSSLKLKIKDWQQEGQFLRIERESQKKQIEVLEADVTRYQVSCWAIVKPMLVIDSCIGALCMYTDSEWWATTQLLIILTSRTFWPGGLCQLFTRSIHLASRWQRPLSWNVLLVSPINSCVVAHQFAIGISLTQLWGSVTSPLHV